MDPPLVGVPMVSPAESLATHITSVGPEFKVNCIDVPLDLAFYPTVTDWTMPGLIVTYWKGIDVL